ETGCKTIDFDAATEALLEVDGDLGRRWIAAGRERPLASRATPRVWVDRWRSWLERCGWPGDRAFDSAEWQARQAWEELLTGFAELAAVETRLSRDAALSALQRLAQETVFAPASSPAPIAILGVLEAAGLPFDALWIAGLTAERWPPAPAPNPFLPLAWQRDRGVPRSSPARELAYAQALTALLARGAPEVVMSSAQRDGDTPLLPSALLLPWAERRLPDPATSYTADIAATGVLEALDDAMIPPVPPQSDARGGAYLIEQFANCPFQAVAAARLDADPWPMPLEGLSASERGRLIHAALAHFWRETRDQASLLQLAPEALSARVADAALRARAELTPRRWRQVAPALVAGESTRLIRILTAWLAHERDRPAFVVEAVEANATLALGGLRLRMRLDRVDTLADGGIAIIDYKGGLAEKPARWFDARRPRAPQLGLYALACRAMAPETAVRAVAYVQLRPDAITAMGLAADVAAWPGLTAVTQRSGAAAGTGATSATTGPTHASEPAFADWSAVEAWWQLHLGAAASAYAAGQAGVTPRESATCRRCGRQLLCRIGGPSNTDGASAPDA
ncbi:MAG: PD-(D/E)XK nuclease family protein, partial [Betaproteobacteria bacterium]